MDVINALVLAALVINLLFALVIHFRSNRSTATILFELTVFAIIGWCVSMFLYRFSGYPQTVFWAKVLYFFPPFIPAGFLLFGLHFPNEKVKKATVYPIIILSLLMSSFSFISNSIIKDVQIVPHGERILAFGWAYYIFYIFYIPIFFTASYYVLLRTYLKSSPLIKAQIRYILIGLTIASMVGMTTNLMLPTFGTFSLNWLGQVSTFIWVGAATYAIVKHRLLDIRLVVARTIAYFLLVVILGVFYALGLFIFGSLLFPEANTNNIQLLVSVLLALILAFTFQPLKRILERITDKVFFRSGYNSNELLSRLTKIMASTLNLEDLTKQTLHDLLNTMHIAHGTFLIFDNGNIYPPVYEGFSSQPHYDIDTIKKLSDLRRIVIFEEENDESIKDLMRQFDFSLSLPLYVGDKLHGLLVLGEKKSGDIYSTQDIEVLGIFGPEISVAVQNAKAYEEIRRFNVTLKQEVERETKQLKDLTEQQKDQVDIMGHEVKTPLTAISQQLNLLLDMILTEEKRKEWLKGNIQLEDAKRVVEGLIKMRAAETQEESIVTNMVEAARLDKLRFELNYSTFDLIELVQMAIKDSEERLETNKQEGKVTLQTELKNLEVEADQTRIKQCVDGLLTNAEKYGRNPTTHTLDVNVTIATDNGSVSISVHDQGMGIDPNDMEKLGKKFSRLDPHTNRSKLPRPGGSGLGLYTYKGIIEHHQGQLIIESEGLGKGSTFTLKFPLKRPQ